MAKSKKLQFLEKILRFMAIAVLKKYKPTIIGITGSVGKTSAKEAIFLVLCSKFRVRKNEKNYNNEIGIPLTIIGTESGNRSLFKWLGVFLKWSVAVIFPQNYPEILVLEMGVDRPGDMKYLTKFIHPKIGVVTNISSSHLEFFKNIDHIAREKGILVDVLPEDGAAIINGDDKRAVAMKEKTKAEVITFGFGEQSKVMASDIIFSYQDQKLEGISFKLNYEEKVIPIRLRHVLARHHVYAVLAAVSVGIVFKINLVEISSALENFFPPSGRMNLIPGIKNCLIIDDTYNASPYSTTAALNVLSELKAPRKIAVLGDMLELGADTEKGHREVARKVLEIGADLFFAVGERMEFAIDEMRKIGYPLEKTFYFEDPVLAGKKLQQEIRENDLILIKGSQSIRMENAVEEIMAQPLHARELLCRQTKIWRKKPF
jgi:UDP-N-acetylmuramoyl-tripeptide--D-alanyl-D-alanine ligase